MKKQYTEAEIQELREELLRLRDYDQAYKIRLNSLYGAQGSNFFRYFDKDLAESITTMGQVSIRGVSKYITMKEPRLKVLYNDTDSVVLDVENFLKDKNFQTDAEIYEYLEEEVSNKIVSPIIKEYFDFLADCLNAENRVKMDRELTAKSGFWLGKKKYALRLYEKDGHTYPDEMKLKIQGIEIIQSAYPKFIRDNLKETIELLFETTDNKRINQRLMLIYKDFKQKGILDIALTKSINNLEIKKLGDKGLPIHARASLLFNKFLKDYDLESKYKKIFSGDKVTYCYIKEPNEFSSNVIGFSENRCPKELLEKIEIDYKTQFNKVFLSLFKRIYESIQWKMPTSKRTLKLGVKKNK